jgi:hypothetical protein
LDHAAEARRHRHQAEELPAKAGLMTDEEVSAQYIRMADGYDMLADRHDRLALNLKNANRAPTGWSAKNSPGRAVNK